MSRFRLRDIRLTRLRAFFLLLLVQAVCAGFFLGDIVISVFGLRARPLAWNTRELMEIGAGLGLMLGMVFGGLVVLRAFRDLSRAQERLDRASGAFAALLETRFSEWGLTLAERDVAMFAIKGLTVAEIARLRETSEGTVKAQTAAIYRKAGVSGRPQLLSLFIEDLMGEDGAARLRAAASPKSGDQSAA
jgi:DNA-binding CsgD family transcriptional regulator